MILEHSIFNFICVKNVLKTPFMGMIQRVIRFRLIRIRNSCDFLILFLNAERFVAFLILSGKSYHIVIQLGKNDFMEF